jgi:2-methylcitrate dehydratase PrpD
VVDPEIPGDMERHMWTRVTVRFHDGREVAIAPRPVPGHPELPLSKDQLREKFMDCARLVLSEDRADTVRQMIEELDACPDLRSLTAILS